MSDLNDDLFGDEDDALETDGDPKDPSAKSADPKSTDKRISDLQSKADKETARANKAEARLKAVLEAEGNGAETGKSPVAQSTVTDAATLAVLDMARMFAVQQYPKLAEYGVGAADLNGATPGEIAQSAAALVARYEKIETRARNKVLAENGFAPEIEAGAKAVPTRDFSAMPKEDFDKILNAALGRR